MKADTYEHCDQPLVSVVLPTYNRAGCVGEAIDTVLRQQVPLELIVVDDGSTDDTAPVVKQYGSRVRYIRQDNRGVSAARNTGIRAAQTPWIAFIDSDDEWAPDKLTIQFDQLARHPGAVAHGANLWIDANDGTRTDLMTLRGWELPGEGTLLPSAFPAALASCFMTQGMVVRREACLKAGLFPERMRIYEDLAFITRVALQGPWVVCGQPLGAVCRKTESEQNLTSLRRTRPMHALSNFVRIYRDLLALQDLEDLGAGQRRVVEHRLSTAWFDLADRLAAEDHPRFSRRAAYYSMRAAPTTAQKLRGIAGLVGCGQVVRVLRERRTLHESFTRT